VLRFLNGFTAIVVITVENGVHPCLQRYKKAVGAFAVAVTKLRMTG
jgi:hypothetical protein